MALNNKIIGLRVKEFRLQKRMSQANLAEQVDMSVTYISLIESAKKQVSLKSLIKIADVLGVTIDNLLNSNQANDLAEYLADMALLLQGSTRYERRIIYDIVSAAIKSFIENRHQQNK